VQIQLDLIYAIQAVADPTEELVDGRQVELAFHPQDACPIAAAAFTELGHSDSSYRRIPRGEALT
jgi:hypothetical protein